MKRLEVTAALIVVLVVLPSLGHGQDAVAPSPRSAATEKPGSCEPDGHVEFICGQPRTEDIYHVPGTDWVVASRTDGGLAAINIRDRKTTNLYPLQGVKESHDKDTYGACPGAPSAEQKARFSTLGISVRPEKNGSFTLYAVHYGWERALDVFELDVRGRTPVVTWKGCVLAPDNIGLNSVAPLPDGGFIGTDFLKRGDPERAANLAKMLRGVNNAWVYEWHSDRGWEKIPGTFAAGPNGVEVSPDGKWVFTNASGGQYFFRVSRGTTPVKRDNVPLSYRPDNMHWAPDGKLLVGGHTADRTYSYIEKFDPDTLEVTPQIEWRDTPAFGAVTAAIQIGDEIWACSVLFDRIAIFPARRN